MKKNLILKLLSVLFLSSCSCKGCEVMSFRCNTWYDFNTRKHHYYDCKMNLSVYLDKEYFVFGVILGENTTCTIHFKFDSNTISNRYNDPNATLDYDRVIYTDSTGETINFNGPLGYTITSSRTIKFDYSNWDEDIKTKFNDSSNFRFEIYDTSFVYYKSDDESSANKVDYDDDLSKVDKEKMVKLTNS